MNDRQCLYSFCCLGDLSLLPRTWNPLGPFCHHMPPATIPKTKARHHEIVHSPTRTQNQPFSRQALSPMNCARIPEPCFATGCNTSGASGFAAPVSASLIVIPGMPKSSLHESSSQRLPFPLRELRHSRSTTAGRTVSPSPL